MNKNRKTEKEGFLFYKSFYEAIETLSIKKQLIAYRAIAKYGLYNEAVQDLPLQVLGILKMAMPIIDANAERYNKKIRRKINTDFDETCDKHVTLPQNRHSSNGADEFIENESDDFEE